MIENFLCMQFDIWFMMLCCSAKYYVIFLLFCPYRFDTEISTLSPPNQDDSFFYIPYSKLTKANPPEPALPCTSSETSASIAGFSDSGASGSSSLATKHTTPCLKFLEGKNMGMLTNMGSENNVVSHLYNKTFLLCSDIADLTGFSKDDKKISKPVKSFGTDDGFKSEAAQCGHSVVQVMANCKLNAVHTYAIFFSVSNLFWWISGGTANDCRSIDWSSKQVPQWQWQEQSWRAWSPILKATSKAWKQILASQPLVYSRFYSSDSTQKQVRSSHFSVLIFVFVFLYWLFILFICLQIFYWGVCGDPWRIIQTFPRQLASGRVAGGAERKLKWKPKRLGFRHQ